MFCIFNDSKHLGISRNQLQVVSLEDPISQDNPDRFIDAFVTLFSFREIGFEYFSGGFHN